METGKEEREQSRPGRRLWQATPGQQAQVRSSRWLPKMGSGDAELPLWVPGPSAQVLPLCSPLSCLFSSHQFKAASTQTPALGGPKKLRHTPAVRAEGFLEEVTVQMA